MNIKNVVSAALELKKFDDAESFVPDYFLAEISKKFGLDTSICRTIRDVIQDVRYNQSRNN